MDDKNKWLYSYVKVEDMIYPSMTHIDVLNSRNRRTRTNPTFHRTLKRLLTLMLRK